MEMVHSYLLQMAFWASGAVFARPKQKKSHFWLRMAGMAVVVGAQTFLIQVLLGNYIWMAYLARAAACFLMVLMVASAWEMSLSVAIYSSIWGISLWQLLNEVWKMSRIVWKDLITKNMLNEVIWIVFLFGVNYVLVSYTIAEWMPKDRRKKIGPRQLASAILIFAIIEMISYAPTMRSLETYNEDWKFLYLSQMMCLVILYLQNELFKKSDMKQELATMNMLWKSEQYRYQISKENIALINQKCHDLKHQVRALRKVRQEEFDEYLNEIEENINLYEAIVKTGNNVFDTILTEKSLYCKDRGIQVSCVADGSQMDFIGAVDLYAILGNAMDNAIEAVEKFEDTEKRQIDVMIYKQQNFLIMNFINPIAGKLVFDEELPVTTKGDKRFHGFGLRSIWHLVKKYDGTLNISEEDGCFSLKILIPIPNEK